LAITKEPCDHRSQGLRLMLRRKPKPRLGGPADFSRQLDTDPGLDTDPLAGRRILFVVNLDRAFLSHRLALGLGAQVAGADVWVAAPDTGRSMEIRQHGLHFVPLKISRNRGRLLGELVTVLSLARLYHRLKPDLVHHVTIKPVLYGSIISRVRRIRTVNAIPGFGHLYGSEESKVLRMAVEWIYRIALRNPRSYTIFQNEEDRNDFTGRGLAPESRAILIRGAGVDCDVFRPASAPPGELIVLFASRMLREKGVEDFVAAARSLRPSYPEVRFVLVGDEDNSPSSVTADQLRGWQEEGVVEWWGYTSPMEDVLHQASIVVLPTFYREGLPKILLEAAACGLPMISTDIPGCRDIVRDGVTGLLVAPHDHQGLIAAIRALLDDGESRRLLGRQARALVVEQFSVEQIGHETLAVYRALLSDTHGR
jgi:glycosyltransferase involved in cell wall biosynthesis